MVGFGKPHANGGFSLLELLVVIAILGILMGMAWLPFREMIANQRLRSVTSDLVADLALARVEATKRSAHVGLASADWLAGWQVFNDEFILDPTDPMNPAKSTPPNGIFELDANGNGVCDVFRPGPPVQPAEECVIAARPALNTTVKVCSADAAFDVLTFGADGTVRAYNAGALLASIPRIRVSSTFASPGVPARQLEFSPTGRVTVVSTGVAPCP